MDTCRLQVPELCDLSLLNVISFDLQTIVSWYLKSSMSSMRRLLVAAAWNELPFSSQCPLFSPAEDSFMIAWTPVSSMRHLQVAGVWTVWPFSLNVHSALCKRSRAAGPAHRLRSPSKNRTHAKTVLRLFRQACIGVEDECWMMDWIWRKQHF